MTFASAFEDAIVNGKSLSDIAKGLERDLLRIGTRTLVTEPLAGAARSLFESAASGLGDSGGGLIGSLFASIFHEGGIVGAGGRSRAVPAALFAGAPRYHDGGWAGLRPDEVPAILQRCERVIPRGEAQRQTNPTIVMNIQTTDAESFRASQGAILAGLTTVNRAPAASASIVTAVTSMVHDCRVSTLSPVAVSGIIPFPVGEVSSRGRHPSGVRPAAA
jgi:hypothetical protein